MMTRKQGCERIQSGEKRRGGINLATIFFAAVIPAVLMLGCSGIMDVVSPPPRIIEAGDYSQIQAGGDNRDLSQGAKLPQTPYQNGYTAYPPQQSYQQGYVAGQPGIAPNQANYPPHQYQAGTYPQSQGYPAQSYNPSAYPSQGYNTQRYPEQPAHPASGYVVVQPDIQPTASTYAPNPMYADQQVMSDTPFNSSVNSGFAQDDPPAMSRAQAFTASRNPYDQSLTTVRQENAIDMRSYPSNEAAIEVTPVSSLNKVSSPRAEVISDSSLPTTPPPKVTNLSVNEISPASEAISVTAVVPASAKITPIDAQSLRQPAVMQQQSVSPADPLVRMITQLEQAIIAAPDDVNAQVTLRCLYARQGRREEALAVLPLIAPEKQTQALTLTRAIILSEPAGREYVNPEDANATLAALEDIAGQVARKADLQIKNLKLCRKVDGFGQYELLDLSQLSDGKPMRLLVYCELENFQSHKDSDGRYTTQLKAWMTVYDSQYAVVTQRIADVTDVPSYNPRRDFFLRGALDVPQLPTGIYRVEVRIEDKVAGKIARPAHMEFEVKP